MRYITNFNVKNERDHAFDFLKNKIELGSFVVFSNTKYQDILIGMVYGFTKHKVRIAMIDEDEYEARETLRDENYIAIMVDDSVPKEVKERYSEIREKIFEKLKWKIV